MYIHFRSELALASRLTLHQARLNQYRHPTLHNNHVLLPSGMELQPVTKVN